MDDTAQSPVQVGQQTVSSPSVPQSPVTPVQPVTSAQNVPGQQQQQSIPQQPASVLTQQQVGVPVGGKEQEIVPVAEVQPTHPEIVVPQEVQEAGVEATPSEEPQLTDEHKEAGLEVAKESTPVPSGPKVVQLPGDYKAPQGFFSLLNQKVKNAATWLYLLLFKAEQQKSLHQPLVEAAQEKKNV